MSKRNVVFSKPDEPLFLKKLKQQIGYCEGPTVDTKREHLPFSDVNDDEEETFDDQPTIVVLKAGDLTAEQVELENKKEKSVLESTTPADLSRKIIFHPAKRRNKTESGQNAASNTITPQEKPNSSKLPQLKASAKLLSFNEEEEEDD